MTLSWLSNFLLRNFDKFDPVGDSNKSNVKELFVRSKWLTKTIDDNSSVKTVRK